MVSPPLRPGGVNSDSLVPSFNVVHRTTRGSARNREDRADNTGGEVSKCRRK